MNKKQELVVKKSRLLDAEDDCSIVSIGGDGGIDYTRDPKKFVLRFNEEQKKKEKKL